MERAIIEEAMETARRYVRRSSLPAHEHDDVVSDVLLGLVERPLPPGRPVGAVVWMRARGAAGNRAELWWRWDRRRRRGREQVPAQGVDAELVLDFLRLSPADRDLVMAVHGDVSDMARASGVAVSTLTRRRARLLEALR